jgi:hypothetical protein
VTADYVPRYLAVLSHYMCLGVTAVLYFAVISCDIPCCVAVLSCADVLHGMDGSQRSFAGDREYFVTTVLILTKR